MRQLLNNRARPLFVYLFCAFILGLSSEKAFGAEQAKSSEAIIVALEGVGAEVLIADEPALWKPAKVNQVLHHGDRFRTKANCRASIRLSNQSTMRIWELAELQIWSDPDRNSAPLYKLLKGVIYVFHRDKPGHFRFETPTVRAGVRGTEFVLRASDNLTTISLIDGEVEMENFADPSDRLVIVSGEEGTGERGQKLRKTAGIIANNVIQWALYYPGVIHVDELALAPAEQNFLADSLAAYREGHLLDALTLYPEARVPASDPEKVYLAALLLGVGKLDKVEELLNLLPAEAASANQLRAPRLATALREVVAAVKFSQFHPIGTPQFASEWLAMSYYHQSQSQLVDALASASKAVEVATNFAFGWTRVAELEFGFGRTKRAQEALNRALTLAPRNAQAVALKGYLLAAQNKPIEAIEWFDRAIQIDSGLGNAWLGRGLCRIRQGKASDGLLDLQISATVEPQRSLFRSYFGKALAQARYTSKGIEELSLARKLDTNDPTPWLYSALLNRDQNRLNESVSDLELSIELNDNRALYRSRLLLDQDLAVRSASLAVIYRDVGMTDVSLREAARAVSYDYANYSAHLFLANSFDTLRDPTRFNLRYETPWFNELLLANLQAPPGVPTISANISQQEYSRLFERDGLGLTTTTEWRSDGQYREKASQFGAWGPFSYSLDLDWQHNEGVRPNNELSRTDWYSQLKYQLTPQDSILALIKYQDYHAGDNFQYYDASSARPAFDYSEMQTPLLLAGWHHEWSPGIHTLFLGGRLVNEQQLGDTNVAQTVAVVNPVGVIDPYGVPFDVSYDNQFKIYSAELNQIFQREHHTDILGVRFQDGNFRADSTLVNPPGLASDFTLPSVSVSDNEFRRVSLYAYHHWEIIDGFLLIGGLAFDDLRYPANFRRPPLNTDESHQSQVSPKAGLLWDITSKLRARAVYSQALGGVSYDGSVRLEPTQLAGFSQSFRSLISETLVGSVEAPRYDILGGAFDLRPWTNAWLSLQGEALRQDVERETGIFNYNYGGAPPNTPASTSERLDYHEFNARVILNQLIGSEWSLEAHYQFTRSELEDSLGDIAATPSYARTTRTDANLHQFGVAAAWQHSSGFFVRGEFLELIQQLGGSTPQPPGDDFPLLNAYVGYRLPRRRGELAVGLMNLLDQEYHLSPLNYHPEYPHERVLYMRLTLSF